MERNSINKFLEVDINKRLPFAWYLLGSMIVITFSFVGQVPMLFFISEESTALMDPKNPMSMFNHLDKNLTLFLLLLSFFIAFLGFLFVLNIHKQSIRSVTTSRKKIDFRRVTFAFTLCSIISVLLVGTGYLLAPEDYEITFQLKPFMILLVISVIFIPFQAGLEEFLFRGYLMQGFAKLTKTRWLPLILTSLIFGSLHIFNPEIDKLGFGVLIFYVGSGLFFGLITLLDEGIELALGYHIANNLIIALLVTSDWTALQTYSVLKSISEPSLMPDILIVFLVLYPFSLLVFAKKYGWSNWKHKLTARIYESTSEL